MKTSREKMAEAILEVLRNSPPTDDTISDTHYSAAQAALDIVCEELKNSVWKVSFSNGKFESRTVPKLDLTRDQDGAYKHQTAKLSFCDFMDGYYTALKAAADRLRG